MDEYQKRYVDELAIYIRWTNKKKAVYGEDVLAWGDYDYRDIHTWNDCFQMIERVLALTPEQIVELTKLAEGKAMEVGKDTPWNYWKETEISLTSAS